MRVAPPLIRLEVRNRLCLGVSKEESVWHIVAPGDRQILLAKSLIPPERLKDGPDEVILSLALVCAVAPRKRSGDLGEPFAKRGGIDRQVGRCADDRL